MRILCRAAWLFLLPAFSQSANANPVTACQASDQATGYNLAQALQDGGNITFDCPSATTIAVNRTLEITHAVTINGGGNVTLDGKRATRLFRVTQPGIALSFYRIVLQGGVPAPLYAASTRSNGGVVSIDAPDVTVNLDQTRIANSDFAIDRASKILMRESRIENNFGIVLSAATLIVENCVFQSNQSLFQQGSGSISIADSLFADNAGSFMLGGSLRITRSRFQKGHSHLGGALSLNGNVAIEYTSFTENSADEGGALYLFPGARVDLRSVRFIGNTASVQGGAIAMKPSGQAVSTASLRHVVFSENSAGVGGAVHLGDTLENHTVLEGSAVSFMRNHAKIGGAIDGWNAAIKLSRPAFIENQADIGGAISLRNAEQRPVILANALFIRNTARDGSAFYGNGGAFINSTIADNRGPAISVFSKAGVVPLSLSFVNSIVANNADGGCMRGLPAQAIENGGNNVQYPDTTCFTSLSPSDPYLDTMYVPMMGGPAFARGNKAVCAASPINNIDFYGQRRPQAGICTIGAVEGDIQRVLKKHRTISKDAVR